MKKAKKTKKRKKLEPLARIRRRLMRLWTQAVHVAWGGRCAVCGSGHVPNAHHIENRNTCAALRYDPMNGVLLCPSHHKFGKDSAHKGGIWFAHWLQTHHRDRWDYVLAHRRDELNVNDRAALAEIEERLKKEAMRHDGDTAAAGGHDGLAGAGSGDLEDDTDGDGSDAAVRAAVDSPLPQDGCAGAADDR